MNGACSVKLFAPPPGALGRDQEVKYHLISITKSISKICLPNFACVLTNERYKAYQIEFSFCRLGHVPGVGLWGARAPRVSKIILFQTWSIGISNRRGWRAEQNASKIFTLWSNCWPWGGGRLKGQIWLNFDYHVNSKIFIQNCVCVLTN